MKNTTLLFIVFQFFLMGCVGTVQESGQDFTRTSDVADEVLKFPGVHSVVPISDTRIEVFFYPATGGSGIYTYDVQVGSAPFPISIPSDVLKPDYRGLLKTTLTNLTAMQSYQIRVEVRDGNSTFQSDSGIIKTATTFDNLVADFAGISAAFNTPGQDGKDSIKIRWTPARSSGSISGTDWDPEFYEVILVDAEKLTPNDMDVPYTPAQGRWVFDFKHFDDVNEYIVRGLPSKTKFYVRMRAIHKGSVDDAYNPRMRGEQNTQYAVISTLSNSLADIKFQPDSFSLALAPGEQGLSAFQASWTPASGVFDHFRLYYGKTGVGVSSNFPSYCLPPILSPGGSNIFCKKADFSMSTTPITGLLPYTDYEAVLVLCATTLCGPLERIVSSLRTIKTDPTSPVFNGAREVLPAQNLNDVGNVYIAFDVPNFTTGYFDGLVLKMRRTLDGSDTPVELSLTSAPYYHLNYNFLTENVVTVKGINYLETEPYCFTLYPYKWETDGVTRRDSPNNIWKCIQPKPEGPTSTQFSGLSQAYTLGTTVTLGWNSPEAGIFSHYEFFWRKQSGMNFNWGDAIAAAEIFDTTNYGRLLIDPETTEISLDGFADGEYSFGVITYFNYVTDNDKVTIRSETNINIKRCVINSLNNEDPVDCTN